MTSLHQTKHVWCILLLWWISLKSESSSVDADATQLESDEGSFRPEEFVNTLTGSFSTSEYSVGNTLPLLGLPWGFNHWSVQTVDDRGSSTSSWWFNGDSREFRWFRCTHQPSPWIGDWGWFLFTPFVGELTRSPPEYFFEPRASVFKPYHIRVNIAPYNMVAELTPSSHGAVLRVAFGDTSQRKSICFAQGSWEESGTSPTPYLYGKLTKIHVDRKLVLNFNMHIYAEAPEAKDVLRHDDMICFRFDNMANIVEVHVATSLISKDIAKRTLHREIPPHDVHFADALKNAKSIWHKMLIRVNIVLPMPLTEANHRHVSIFYTSLYRSLLFPRRLDEYNAMGDVVHYSPYDNEGKIYPGPLCTDNGFWDTFRTVYPLLSFLYPDYLGSIVEGWLNAYKEGGWLPSWASPGYRNCMVGTFADVVVADAIVKNIRGFDVNLAIEALQKDAFANPPSYAAGAMGKDGLSEYVSLGFVPNDVSRTLDFGFADYATSQAFRALCSASSPISQGRQKIEGESFTDLTPEQCEHLLKQAKELQSRSDKAVLASFDTKRGFMVPKSQTGVFSPNFNDVRWGNGYTEGNAWHHSFPPYAVGLLTRLFAETESSWTLSGSDKGRQLFLSKLKDLFMHRGDFNVGSYGQVIHEMREMRSLAMGQYGHNNQPSHHIPFLFSLLGKPHVTYSLVREILNRAYGLDFYSGDEDNGEQSSWFVMAALGLFSVTPGSPDYVLCSPLFPYVEIYRGPSADLVGSSVQGTYRKYDVVASKFVEAFYRPFRVDGSEQPVWPLSSSGIDSDVRTLQSDTRKVLKRSSPDTFLHLIAQDVSEETVNIQGVYVTTREHLNSFQLVSTSMINDAILQRQDMVLRFVTEREITGRDSLTGKSTLPVLMAMNPVTIGIFDKVPPICPSFVDSIIFGVRKRSEVMESRSEGDYLTELTRQVREKDDKILSLEGRLRLIEHSDKVHVSPFDLKVGSAADDKMILNESERLSEVEVTWDIYIMLAIAMIMAAYLGAILIDTLGITGGPRRSVGALIGFERPFAVKSESRTV